jgi:hypothetical protein
LSSLAYTRIHSGQMPSGAQTEDFIAYAGGGFFSLQHPYGWQVCLSRGEGSVEGVWELFATHEDHLVPPWCTEISLFVKDARVNNGTATAWSYQ